MTKCAICRDVYTKWSMSQKVCGKVECKKAFAEKLIIKIEKKAAKDDRKKTRQALEDLEPKGYWIKRLKLYFHRYIRLRDANKPCISCGQPLKENKFGGTVDAGHFRSVGSAPHLRFEAMNVHAQCKHCNRTLQSNHSEYRKGFIERYGIGEVEWIEADQRPRHYSIDDLKSLITVYQNKYKELNR